MSKLSFNPPDQVLPVEIQAIAKRLDLETPSVNLDGLVLPVLPARSIDELLHAISEDKSHEISLLEWITLFDGKDEWDEKSKYGKAKSNILIWEVICNLPSARRQALWRLCQYLSGRTELFAKGMADTFDTCLDSMEIVEKDKARIIQSIRKQAGLGVASLALEAGCKPVELFVRAGLPPEAADRLNSLYYLERAYKLAGYAQNAPQYLMILKNMTNPEQDEAVARLLKMKDYSKLREADAIIEFLKRNYSPDAQGSRWSVLDDEAKKSFRDLLGHAWFAEFRGLIYLLTSPQVSKHISLDDRACNQLKKRVTFWENYQSRLRRFRVFFPDKTVHLANSQGINLSDHGTVDGFPKASQETEVCVLEFDEHIIVEFLRGHISELKIFNKSDEGVDTLLSSNRLSIGQILDLKCRFEHDHLYCWQNVCADLLRDECSIVPDDYLVKFKIDDGFFIKYMQGVGIEPLTNKQRSTREQKLLEWSQRKSDEGFSDSIELDEFYFRPGTKLYLREKPSAYAYVDSLTSTHVIIKGKSDKTFKVPKEYMSMKFKFDR